MGWPEDPEEGRWGLLGGALRGKRVEIDDDWVLKHLLCTLSADWKRSD